jgi:hypothetical protein
MLGSEMFSTPDTFLPGSVGHCAIMGLRLGTSNCVGLEFSCSVRVLG